MELVQKIAEEGKLTNSIHEATITLKTGKDTTFKKRERERKENYRQANVIDKHRCKSHQQKTSKCNPTIHQKGHMP